MPRNLFVLGDSKSALRSALEKELTLSPGLLPAPASRSSQVERQHVLFIDATAHEDSTILAHQSVKVALSAGVPVVIHQPMAGLLTALIGFGVEDVRAALIVTGERRVTYCKTYMNPSSVVVTSETVSVSETEWASETASVSETDEEIKGESANEPVPVVTGVEPDPEAMVIEDLAHLDHIEEAITRTAAIPQTRGDAIPENRRKSTFWTTNWRTGTFDDPSDETNKTQTARFNFSVVFTLTASDHPKVKIFDIAVSGTGWEPFASGKGMIRNDHNHRGWAQSLTQITFEPGSTVFGSVQDYVPVNSADEVSITVGYTWNLGFAAGAGPDGPSGSLSASFSKNNSHTITSKDFRTLTESANNNGMRFYHNAYIVGGDTRIDPRQFFNQPGWNSEMNKMFYSHISGIRVRYWPNLSMQLVKPDMACVYYASSTTTGVQSLTVSATQGLNYFFKRGGTKYNSPREIKYSAKLSFNFSEVTYTP